MINVEYIDLKPNSKPQLQFFNSDADQLMYGGEPGGGKSFGVVMKPVYKGHTDNPSFKGFIARETIPELKRFIQPICKKYYTILGAKYIKQERLWVFPSGAEMHLIYLSDSDDWERYMGGAWTYQGFDEATRIKPENYNILAWNRSDCGIKPYATFATNPGGPSHKKFKTEFVDICPPITDGKLKWSELAKMYYQPKMASPAKTVDVEYEGIKKTITRQFIPASVFDNEHLLKADPGYYARLMALPVGIRSLLLEGWDLNHLLFFAMLRRDIHFIKAFDPPKDWKRISGMDYGNYTVAELIAYNGLDFFVYGEWKAENTRLESFSKSKKAQMYYNYLKKMKELDILTVGDVTMFNEWADLDDKRTAAWEFKELGLRLEQVVKKSPKNKKYRIYCNEEISDLIDWEKGNTGLWVRKPHLYIMAERCPALAETLFDLQKDPDNPEDLDPDVGIDHPYDALKYGVLKLRPPVSAEDQKKLEDYYKEKTFI